MLVQRYRTPLLLSESSGAPARIKHAAPDREPAHKGWPTTRYNLDQHPARAVRDRGADRSADGYLATRPLAQVRRRFLGFGTQSGVRITGQDPGRRGRGLSFMPGWRATSPMVRSELITR